MNAIQILTSQTRNEWFASAEMCSTYARHSQHKQHVTAKFIWYLLSQEVCFSWALFCSLNSCINFLSTGFGESCQLNATSHLTLRDCDQRAADTTPHSVCGHRVQQGHVIVGRSLGHHGDHVLLTRYIGRSQRGLKFTLDASLIFEFWRILTHITNETNLLCFFFFFKFWQFKS